MIACFKCGQENEYDSTFCSNCGRYLVAKKETPQRFDIQKAVIYHCPSSGVQREENFQRCQNCGVQREENFTQNKKIKYKIDRMYKYRSPMGP